MGNQPRVKPPSVQIGHPVRDSALGLVTETLDAILPLQAQVWQHNSLTPSQIEILRLRNARTVNCVFCKSVRYDVARRDGLTEEKVQLIDDDFQNSALSLTEKLLIAFADTYLHDPRAIDPQLIADLRNHFSSEQIAHMALSLTTFHAMSRCAVALGGMPESLPIMEVPVQT